MQGGSNSTAGVSEGDILVGQYRVERVLAIGSTGVVVAAHHIQLDEKVALKFLLPESLGNSEAVARFAREARAAMKIKSEHVARVMNVGTLPNGAPYMVMEYLTGEDLAAWLQEQGPLPVEQAVEYVLQACEAIAEAHALGIVHWDLKPANLFCIRRTDGRLSIKVLNLGISKMTDTTGSAQRPVTSTSGLIEWPFYMSPEQMRSPNDVGAPTDIWALGVVLFELMTGLTPFTADTVRELANKIASAPTPAIRSFRPDVPDGLEATIFKCLEKDPLQRYTNVAVLAWALLPFAPSWANESVERISRALGLSASAAAVSPSLQTESTPPRSGLAALGAALTKKRPSRSLTKVVRPILLLFFLVRIGVYLSRAAERQAASSPLGGICKPNDFADCTAKCEKQDMPSCINLGLMYENGTGVTEDAARAAALYEKGCDRANATACYNLGLLYAGGKGVTKDEARAAALYEKGCDGDQPKSCTNLGLLYERGDGVSKDEARAVALYEQGCDGGNGVGCNNLGAMYEKGRGVPTDRATAIGFYRQGCKLGSSVACDRLKRLGESQ
jgi:serine/threonine-protein kinase